MAIFDYEGLRDAIADGLADYLGRYTYANGISTAAIILDEGNQQYPPDGSKVSGLECIVLMNPEVPMEDIVGGYRETYSAVVMLRQWDSTKAITREIIDTLRNTIDRWDYEVMQSNRVRMLRSGVIDLEQFRVTVSKVLMHT